MSIKTPEQQRTFEALATKLKGVAPTGPQMEEVQAAVDELLTVIGSRWEWCWAQPKFHKALNAILAASTALAVTQGLLWLLAVIGFGPLGPIAGTLAAWIQSTYGIGFIFSTLQRIGMIGLRKSVSAAIVATGVAVAMFPEPRARLETRQDGSCQVGFLCETHGGAAPTLHPGFAALGTPMAVAADSQRVSLSSARSRRYP